MLNASLEMQFALRIARACEIINLPCSAYQIKALISYLNTLQRWNKIYNLTAFRHLEQMLVQHVFDSLTVVPSLLMYFDANQPYSVCDVGAGGGLPGVVIAIMVPTYQVHCIDAVEKKVAFIRQVVGILKLPNLRGTHARIETLPDQEAEIVISRAFASLHDFAICSGRHVKKQGALVNMKGKFPDDEIKFLDASKLWYVERVETLKVPELEAHRCLVWMNRVEGAHK